MAGAKRSRSCGPDLAPGVIPSSMPLLDLQLRITLPDCFHRSNIVVDLDRVRRALLRIAAISMSSSARSVEDLEHAQIDPDVRAERRRRLAESPLALPTHGFLLPLLPGPRAGPASGRIPPCATVLDVGCGTRPSDRTGARARLGWGCPGRLGREPGCAASRPTTARGASRPTCHLVPRS